MKEKKIRKRKSNLTTIRMESIEGIEKRKKKRKVLKMKTKLKMSEKHRKG